MKNAIFSSSIQGVSAPVSRRAAMTFLNQLLRPGALIVLACLCLSAYAQTGEWTWMGGSSTIPPGKCEKGPGEFCGQPGVYGAKGVPAARNVPGGREDASSWTDSSGHLWLFGGDGFGADGTWGFLNDLWEFSPSTNQWTWMGGNSQVRGFNSGWPGVYGVLGTPAAGNMPGARESASSWTDSSGRLWLFGGFGFDINGNFELLNDMWMFNPSTNKWVWMGGSNTGDKPGVYGTLQKPSEESIPGGRELTMTWTDNSGNFWLFGGVGYDANDQGGYPSDLWEFNPYTNEWAWMGGSSSIPVNCNLGLGYCGKPGVYGKLKVFAHNNIPGARYLARAWTDKSNHFWLFGGQGYDASGSTSFLNDLWEYNPSINEWAWMGGNSTIGAYNGGCIGGTANNGHSGVYGALGVPVPGNAPGSRSFGSSWSDSSGGFWLFSGAGYDGIGGCGDLNDLWELNPSTNEWSWVGGSSTNTFFQPGVYGKLRTPAAENIPGLHETASNWTDSSGSFWLFGGFGFDANGNQGYSNELWVYQITPGTLPATTPTFSVAAGNYTSGQTVKISDATPDATIYYTLDGSAPTGKSAQFKTALSIAKTTIVKAIAVAAQYGSSAVASATYAILKTQMITFAQPTSPVTYGVKPITLSAKASSGLAVSFSVVSGPGKVSGTNNSTLTITGAGTIVVAANQAGNATYAAAPLVKRSITVHKAAQTITFTQPTSPVTYGVKPLTLSASASSKLAVSFSVVSGPGKVSGTDNSTLTITGSGAVVIAANQTGNVNYNTAPQVKRTIAVNKAAQTITFTQPTSPVTYGVKPITLSATASSGLAVSFSVVSGPGTVSGTDNSTLTITGAGTVVVAANQAGNANYSAAPQVERSIIVNNPAAAFVYGADVGWLTQLESMGYTWTDTTGAQASALQILKNHGVNTIRIRTFVNPTITAGVLGVGDLDQAGSIALAKTASAMGFQIVIDFHYSDTWADPGHQTLPAAWANHTYAQLQTDVYKYTYNFMTALVAAGVTPQYVQVGNEINTGMLWPIGSVGATTVNGNDFTHVTGLINQGYAAVKAASKSTQVIIHIAGISNLADFEWFFDGLTAASAKFDVIGASYYDGPSNITTVASNLNTLAARYNKPVMICEIGYRYSDPTTAYTDVHGAIEAVNAVPNKMGLGVIYWEPEAPDDASTNNYTMGAVTEGSGKVLQFTTAINAF
jgi:arabinogalactan endo-1,4-beta-galactosidase/N-acetylneuraminic acid mutarotase